MVTEASVSPAPNKIAADVVPIELIRPSSLNSRGHFDPDRLAELALSPRALR